MGESPANMAAPIYLDYNATTPVDPRVFEAMRPWLEAHYGNPSSGHALGRKAREAIEAARAEVAALIGARPDEIVFTAHATEANNLAILGTAEIRQGGLMYSAVEHPSVVRPMRHLASAGRPVTEIPVDAAGQIRPEDLAVPTGTALVSIMLANNEVGTIQPVGRVAQRVRDSGARLHVDAAQAVGKISVHVDALGCDLLTLAGHKFHAPKGIGALYVRNGTPISAIQFGANQENGLRPGTENVPYIVALGEAARLARAGLGEVGARMAALRDELHDRLASAIPGLNLNGHVSERLPNTLNVSFPGAAGWRILESAPAVAASTGSACHAGSHAGSSVLQAMGCDEGRAAGAVRLSVGRFTTAAEVAVAAEALIAAWRSALSPPAPSPPGGGVRGSPGEGAGLFQQARSTQVQ